MKTTEMTARMARESIRYDEIAKAAVWLIFSSKTWTNRRVDSVSFSDLMSINRRVSVDLDIPSDLVQLGEKYGELLMPIAAMHKGSMVNFNTDDEHKRTWSLCSLDETTAIEKHMLMRWADACGLCVHSSLITLISRVVKSPPEEARGEIDAYDFLLSDDQGKLKAFLTLALFLARDRIIFARIPMTKSNSPESSNRVLKFSYDRPVQFESLRADVLADLNRCSGIATLAGRRWLRYLMFLDPWPTKTKEERPRGKIWKFSHPDYTQMVITASNASYAKNYHFQLTVPDGVAITKAALYDEKNARVEGSVRLETVTRCDLYGEDHTLPLGTRGRVFVRLSPIRNSWMVTAISASIVACVALLTVGAFLLLGKVNVNSRTAVIPVLTVIAGGPLFAVLMQPEENSFSRYLMHPFRIFSTCIAGFSAIAITVVCSLLSSNKSDNWAGWVSLVSSLILAGGLTVATKTYLRFPEFMAKKKSHSVKSACATVVDLAERVDVYYQPHLYRRSQEHELLDGEGGTCTAIEAAVREMGCNYKLSDTWRGSRKKDAEASRVS